MPLAKHLPDTPDVPQRLRGRKVVLDTGEGGIFMGIVGLTALTEEEAAWLLELVRPSVDAVSAQIGREIVIGKPRLL